jgi:hypothetical protein
MKLYEWEIKYIDEKIKNLIKRINRKSSTNKTTNFYQDQKMYRELEGLERIKYALHLQANFIEHSLER